MELKAVYRVFISQDLQVGFCAAMLPLYEMQAC
jgi:hypothetical protein